LFFFGNLAFSFIEHSSFPEVKLWPLPLLN